MVIPPALTEANVALLGSIDFDALPAACERHTFIGTPRPKGEAASAANASFKPPHIESARNNRKAALCLIREPTSG